MNADQTIALAAVISGGAVGLAGVAASVASAMGDRSQERNLARTERRQVRLAEAYIGLLEMVEQVGMWAQTVRPVLDSDPPREPQPLPDLDVQRAVYARVNAYGSQNIKKLMARWQAAVADVRRADGLVGLRQEATRRHGGAPIRGSTEFMDDLTPWMELEDKFRPAEEKARGLLTNWVAAELNE